VALKQVNLTYLTARHAATRNAMGLSKNAVLRAQDLADLAPSELLGIMREGRAVLLPYVDSASSDEQRTGHRFTYHVFYRAENDAFFIAVVEAFRPSHIGGVSQIVDLLPLKAFEQTEGKVSRRFQRTAASRVLNPVDFREWETRAQMVSPGRPRVRVITYFDGGGEHPHHVVFTSPPVCQPYIDQYGLGFAFGHPRFTEWYRANLEAAGIDADQVVSLRIADTDKQVLQLAAPARDCPNCPCLTGESPARLAASSARPGPQTFPTSQGWNLTGLIKREWRRLVRRPQ
jgi:hypothetical protein